jgi:membrane-associated phospholipid phosphatase
VFAARKSEGAVDTGQRFGGDRSSGRDRRAGRYLRLGRPLLPASARRWAGALVICCGAFIAAVGVVVAHHTTADRFDHAVDAPVVGWFGGHHGLALWLAFPGSLIPAITISAAIVVACVLAGRLNGALLALMAVPVAGGVTEYLVKPLVHRTLLGGIAYPSGHTTAIVALAATLTVLLLDPPRPGRAVAARAAILAVAYALVVGVVIGLIGLRWHYFTDTVAGAAVGGGTVCALALALDARVVRRLLGRGDGTADPAERHGPSAGEAPERLR